MKRRLALILLVLAAALAGGCHWGRFVMDICPASILVPTEDQGFVYQRVSAWGDAGWNYVTTSVTLEQEAASAGAFWSPSVAAGVLVPNPVVNFRFTGALGALVNSLVGGPLLRLDAEAGFHLGADATLGPSLSLVSIPSPDYDGEAGVEIDGATGVMPAIVLRVGGDDAHLLVSAGGLLGAESDITLSEGWMGEPDSLDWSGFMFTLGCGLGF